MGPVIVSSVKVTWNISNIYFSTVLFLPVYTFFLRKNSDALSPSSVLYTPWTVGSLVLRVLPFISTCLCLFFGESGLSEIFAYLKIRNHPSLL